MGDVLHNDPSLDSNCVFALIFECSVKDNSMTFLSCGTVYLNTAYLIKDIERKQALLHAKNRSPVHTSST